jgi:peptidyl-prolyl cis-trans isomerase D
LTSFALPSETNYVISLVNQERDIEYINIPLQLFLTQSIQVAPEKIRAYYNQHQNDFLTPEQVSIEYVELSLKNLISAIHPTDATLRNFYNENVNSYTRPTEWKLTSIDIPVVANASSEQTEAARRQAEEVLRKAQTGADFIKISQQFPNKTLNSNNWMTLNQIPAELQKSVAELNKSNRLSQIIKTSHGFVIAKVLDIKEPQVQPFEVVKDKVKEMYVHQYAEEKFSQLREQLANLSYEHPDSLSYVSKSMGLKIQTTELFSKDKVEKNILAYKQVRDTAFSHDVLSLQNNSDVIQVHPETVIVLRVKSHIPSALLPLSGVYKQIENKLKIVEAEKKAEKFAGNIKDKLQSGLQLKQIPQATHLSWRTVGYIGRYSTKVDSAILDIAFRMPNPSMLQARASYGVIRTPAGYAVVALKSVKDGSISDSKQYAIFSEQVQNSEGLLEYELYKLSQTNQANIKVEK